jgi:trk system potassium uptake protein TrkA
MTLPADSPYVGKPAGRPVAGELRAGHDPARRPGLRPDADQPLEAGDELLFVVPADVEDELERLLAPGSHG